MANIDKDALDVVTQVNKELEKRQRLLAKSTKELKDQLTLMNAIASAGKDGFDFDDAIKQIEKMSVALNDALNDVDRNADATKKVAAALEQMAARGEKSARGLGDAIEKRLTKKFPELAGAISGFITGLSAGFNVVTVGARAAYEAISWLGGGIFDIGRAIISIPFKILGGLVQMANEMPGSTAFAEAREAIRKDFGSFAEDLALTTKTMYKHVRGELAETGLSVWRTLGNWAERLRAMHEIVKGMGPMATLFRDELRGAFDPRTTEWIIAFKKGLGISDEHMRQIGLRAKVAGKSMTDTLTEITAAAVGFADAFGLSQKVISRDISEMNADVANFGSMTVHEMGRAAVYVRKLGLEIKEVMGIIDKYDNFEDAAMGAAHLAQAFGANVDALEMMREQDPSKRLDMLRKSMAAAGVDAERLSRQELKLLAQHTGLSEEAAKAAFSLRNQGVSMAELEKQQQRNEKSTITQEEAMMRLSASIERVIKAGHTSGGFFAQFMQGFDRGIKMFTKFRRVLYFIRRDLRIFRWLGIQTAQLFVKYFPGVKDMIDGLYEFFNPRRFYKLKRDLAAIFGDIFKGDVTLKEGLRRITGTFVDFISGPGGKKFIEGLRTFGVTIMKFIGEGMRIGFRWIADAMRKVAEFIRNPSEVIAAVKSGAMSGAGFVGELFQPIVSAIVDSWPMLRNAFVELWDTAWPRIKTTLTSAAEKALPGFVATIFGPAVIQAVIGQIAGKMLGGVGKFFKDAFARLFSGGAAEGAETGIAAATKPVQGVISRFAGKLLRVGKGVFSKAFWPLAIADAFVNISDSIEKYGDKITSTTDDVAKKLGAAATGLVNVITFGLLPDSIELWIANKFAGLSDAFFKGIESVFGKDVLVAIKSYADGVIDFLSGLGETIMGVLTLDFDKIKGGLRKTIAGVGETLFGAIKGIFIDIPVLIGDVLGDAWDGLVGKVGEWWDRFTRWFDDLTAGFREFIDDPVGWAKKKGKAAANWTVNVAKDVGRAVKDGATAIVNELNAMSDEIVDRALGGGSRISTRGAPQISSGGGIVAKIVERAKQGIAMMQTQAQQQASIKNMLEKEAAKLGGSTMSQGGIVGIFDRFTKMDPAEVKTKLKKFEDVIATLTKGDDSVVGIVKRYMVDVGPDIVDKLSRASIVVGAIERFSGVSDTLARVVAAASFAGKEEQLASGIKSIKEGFVHATEHAQTIGAGIDDATLMSIETSKARVKTVVDAIEEMVMRVNSLHKSLSNVETEPIRTKLKNVARSLGVKNERFEIKHDNVVIKIKLDVNMDAEQIAYAIKQGQWFTLPRGLRGSPSPRSA